MFESFLDEFVEAGRQVERLPATGKAGESWHLAAGQLAAGSKPAERLFHPALVEHRRQLAEAGLTEGSEPYEAAFDEQMEQQRQRVASRLFTPLPQRRHVCFYPMNKRRGEALNWYTESFERRAALMREHGMIGRQYAGRVTQVISGSIGYDDWEWGVDLFAADPLVFKKLIYEMRFDEASAKFAEFGPFYTGLQFAPASLGAFLNGSVAPLS